MIIFYLLLYQIGAVLHVIILVLILLKINNKKKKQFVSGSYTPFINLDDLGKLFML